MLNARMFNYDILEPVTTLYTRRTLAVPTSGGVGGIEGPLAVPTRGPTGPRAGALLGPRPWLVRVLKLAKLAHRN